MEIIRTDVAIIGSGIAGLRAALELAPKAQVLVITKGRIHEGSSVLAQGGIAAAMDDKDKPELHYEDTIAAGAGLCNQQAVRILVKEGVDRVKELLEWGTKFDADQGVLQMAHEAAHQKRRVLHAGDSTGREIEKCLGNRALSTSQIRFMEHTQAFELHVVDGRVQGLYVLNLKTQQLLFVDCKAVLLATGGFGQLYSHNTNPAVNTGDGLALAFRAGAAISDLEFVQFHPTTLYTGDKLPVSIFLISEAVRGEGATLRNIHGEPFMQRYDARKELAPRDIVARAIVAEMKATQAPHVYLDLSSISGNLSERFANIYKRCLETGIDIEKDFVPVAPAAHYCMGGVLSNLDGESTIAGLLVAGEVASTGVHGANRLASNSLLEGLVFGRRAALTILDKHIPSRPTQPITPPTLSYRYKDYPKAATLIAKQNLRELLWRYVGIERQEDNLRWALLKMQMFRENFAQPSCQAEVVELQNMILAARLLCQFALYRKESRGAHFRSDFPTTRDTEYLRHFVMHRESQEQLTSLMPSFATLSGV